METIYPTYKSYHKFKEHIFTFIGKNDDHTRRKISFLILGCKGTSINFYISIDVVFLKKEEICGKRHQLQTTLHHHQELLWCQQQNYRLYPHHQENWRRRRRLCTFDWGSIIINYLLSMYTLVCAYVWMMSIAKHT